MPFPRNPFIFGDPVRGVDFLDRKQELRHLATRVYHGGSALVTAEPRMGKTSLLLRLQDAAATIFGPEEAARMTFRYLDGHTVLDWDAARFWREVLRPCLSTPAESDDFHALEDFFARLEAEGRRLVLLLDEFDALVGEPQLHQRAVFGWLRSLASRYRSFSLVAASRRTLTELNYATREFSHGSPYFNFMLSLSPGPLPQKAVESLLKRGAKRFTRLDRQFLQYIGGAHPYFLQAAAYFLWACREEDTPATIQCYIKAATEFYAEVGESVLSDIWRAWPPYAKMAFTLAALEAMPRLLGKDRAFRMSALRRDLSHLEPELRYLAQRGFLREAPQTQTGYTPHAEVMLWFLADELTRVLRPEMDLKTWLTAQQWDGLLTKGEKEALHRALDWAADLLREGAKAFIREAAKGAAEGLARGATAAS